MRSPATSSPRSRAVASLFVAIALALGLAPAFGAQAAVAIDQASDGEAALVADALAGTPSCFVSRDVPLAGDAEPVIGSFIVDGMAYAVTSDDAVELVAVAPSVLADALTGAAPIGSDGVPFAEGSGSGVPPRNGAEQVPSGATSPQPSPEGAPSDGAEGEDASEPVVLAVLESVEHDGIAYSVTSIGPRAFAGCDADVVTIPAAVGSVDEAAFRGSAVASVEVADGNPNLSSYDGMLFDADMTSLLLVPEGKQGAARIPKAAEVVPADAFSHCASVTAIEADAGSAAFSSRNGCLYDASGEALVASPPAIDAMRALGARAADTGNIHATADGLIYHYYDGACTQLLSSGASGKEGAPRRFKLAADLHWECVKDYPGKYPWYARSPTRTLVGWSRYADGRALIPVGATMSTYDNVYAIFGWRVAWDANGGEVDPATSPAADGQPVASPVPTRKGHRCLGWFTAPEGGELACEPGGQTPPVSADLTLHAQWEALSYPLSFDPNGGSGGPGELRATFGEPLPSVADALPTRPGFSFLGWADAPEGGQLVYGPGGEPLLGAWERDAGAALCAQWEEQAGIRISYDLGSEPGGGEAGSWPEGAEPPMALPPDAGLVALPDPVRAGYVLAGWAPNGRPDAEGLLSRGEDGAWRVDAAKLPALAGEAGEVSLVARWAAKVDVDAPLAATFLYDLSAPEDAESATPKDAWTGSALVRNRSAAPVRVSGLESAPGPAASTLRGPDGAPLAQALADGPAKVLSAFPTDDPATGTRADAEGPASDGAGDDLAHKVDLALGDVLLEAPFASSPDGSADPARRAAWTVPAAASDEGEGPGTLKLGFRLNLGEASGASLDRAALSALTGADQQGASPVALATLSWCFALEGAAVPPPTGTKDDPLWVEVTDEFVREHGLQGEAAPGVYGLADIKAAADDLASRVSASTDPNDYAAIEAEAGQSPYWPLYAALMESQGRDAKGAELPGPYFKLKVGGAYHDVHSLGLCQDSLAEPRQAGGRAVTRAGLTFGFRDIYENRRLHSAATTTGGWKESELRAYLSGSFQGQLGIPVEDDGSGLAVVKKWQQDASSSAQTTNDVLFIPSHFEVFGHGDGYATGQHGSESASNSFLYQGFSLGKPSVPGNLNLRAKRDLNGKPGGWFTRSGTKKGTYAGLYDMGQITQDGKIWTWKKSVATGVLPCFAL